MLKKYFNNYKEEIKEAFNDLKHKDTFYKQIPNILTFMRLTLAVPAGVLYYFNPILSILSIGFLWLTDAVDGPIARKFGIQSKLGADMDTVADKIMFLASTIPLLGSIPFLTMNLCLEGVISFINVYGRMKGLNTKTVFSGKLKTVSMAITLVYGYLFQFFGLSNVIKVALLGITSFLQTLAIHDYVEEFDRMKCELENNKNTNEDSREEIIQEETLSKSDELRKIRTLVLTSQILNKKYKGKKRVRKLIQEKKNI